MVCLSRLRSCSIEVKNTKVNPSTSQEVASEVMSISRYYMLRGTIQKLWSHVCIRKIITIKTHVLAHSPVWRNNPLIGSHFALRERAKKPHNVSRITIQCYFLMGFLTLLELVNIPFCHAFLPLLNVTIQKKIEWGMYIQNIPILLLDGWVSYEETAMFQNGVGWCLSKSASNPKLVTLVNLHAGSNRYFCLSYSCILL